MQNTTTNPTTPAFATDAEQSAALRKPFPVSEVQTREQGGKTLHYYEHAVILVRLLDVFGSGLSISTTNVRILDGQVDLETTLDVEWVSGRRSKVSGWGSALVHEREELCPEVSVSQLQ